MSSSLSGGDFGRLLEETISALKPTGTAGGPEEGAEIRGQGEALDGFVTVVAKPGGRLESLTLNPRVLRTDSATLAAEILTAVNAALDDLQAKVNAAVPAVPPSEALVERLKEIQDTSVRRMETFLQTIGEVQNRIAGGRA